MSRSSIDFDAALALERAELADSYVAGAKSAHAKLAGGLPIPVIAKIDAVILSAIKNGGSLKMGIWHGPGGWCGTMHCRAGWAVHCAGEPGRSLEEKLGTMHAAVLIYQASRPGEPLPWFFGSKQAALADIKKCAAEQSARDK